MAFLGDKFFSWLPSIMTSNVYELILIIEEIIVSIQQLIEFFMNANGPGEFFPLIHEIFSGAHHFFRFLKYGIVGKSKKYFRKSVLSIIDMQVLAVENNKNFREYGKYLLFLKPIHN